MLGNFFHQFLSDPFFKHVEKYKLMKAREGLVKLVRVSGEPSRGSIRLVVGLYSRSLVYAAGRRSILLVYGLCCSV